MSETRNLLLWRWDIVKFTTPDQPPREVSCWVAEGIAGRRYNILIDKGGCEALIRLPSGHIFIAAIEEQAPVLDDVKAYLQADHDQCCSIRDLSAYMAHKETEKALKPPTRRIILPPDQS